MSQKHGEDCNCSECAYVPTFLKLPLGVQPSDLKDLRPGPLVFGPAEGLTPAKVRLAKQMLEHADATQDDDGNPMKKLPTDNAGRKALPVFDGDLMYFPLASLAVAEVSRVGNDQHNPGERLHWARGKSMDQLNTSLRHQMDHGMGNQKDTDGTWHLAKAIWRLKAELELAMEAAAQRGEPLFTGKYQPEEK